MMISSSQTPADLSGFDILISWTVSNISVLGTHCISLYLHLTFCNNSQEVSIKYVKAERILSAVKLIRYLPRIQVAWI